MNLSLAEFLPFLVEHLRSPYRVLRALPGSHSEKTDIAIYPHAWETRIVRQTVLVPLYRTLVSPLKVALKEAGWHLWVVEMEGFAPDQWALYATCPRHNLVIDPLALPVDRSLKLAHSGTPHRPQVATTVLVDVPPDSRCRILFPLPRKR